jgi:hypothetical protein
MRLLQRHGQSFRPARNHYQKHVVRHQAGTHYRQAFNAHRLAQQIEINHPLGIGRQKELPPIAALRHMVRRIRHDRPR